MNPLHVTADGADPIHLVRKAQGGDMAALGMLYDRFAPALFLTVRRVTDSSADAEDVVHDVFVGLPEALRSYDEQGRFSAWLARVGIRHAMMRRRACSRRREDGLDRAAEIHGRDDIADSVEHTTEHLALHSAVRALPEPLRYVLILRQVEGLSHDEIAGILGISVANSRTRLARALDNLRRALTTDPS